MDWRGPEVEEADHLVVVVVAAVAVADEGPRGWVGAPQIPV